LLKILKDYLEIIATALERLWSVASEHSTAEQTENESVEFSDDFDHLGASFMKSPDKECYGRLICKIFMKECLMEMLLMHLRNSFRKPDVRGTESIKAPSKLAKLVAQMLAKLAENMMNRLSADHKQRIKISRYCSEKLTMLLADGERDDFVCSADFVAVVSSFVPMLSVSVRERLMVLLLQSPEKCITDELEDGSRSLSDHGKLMVHILQHVLNELSLLQPEVLTDINVRLCKIIKLVPSDEVMCSCLTAVAERMPLLASNVSPDVVSSLLKSGTQSSLDLMMYLAADSETCRQLMCDWFLTHKMWKSKDCLALYVDAVLFILKACEKGRWMVMVLWYLLCIMYDISNGVVFI